jgi:hypothetical protein
VAQKRKYTGVTDGPAAGKRAGTEEFVKQVHRLTGGALWNNGTWVVRNKNGKTSLSVHATGRAMDLSYRKVGAKGKPNGRQHAQELIRLLVANNEELGVEMILDYFPQPHGRGWRCDRQAWTKYSKATITGAPGGDWIHVEISPKMADSPQAVRDAFAKVNLI